MSIANKIKTSKGFIWLLPKQGRHNTKTIILFAILALAITTIALLTYANQECIIACNADVECDDTNPNTLDVCNNDGSCNSKCTNILTAENCSVACSYDSGCNDQDQTTTDICNNEGTCEARCTNILTEPETGLNAPTTDTNTPTVDTNTPTDQNAPSTDTNNPVPNNNTQTGQDTNAPDTNTPSSQECEIACHSDSECSDGNSTTIDICNKEGSCESKCTNIPTQEEKRDSCTCPIEGHWQVKNKDVCSLSTQCNLKGDLHIVDGSLTITPTGELVIAAGQKLIIEKSSSGTLVIEKGGKMVVHK